MVNSHVFDYINVIDRAADASALRNEILSNNIANQDTPGFKRQDIDFETELAHAMRRSKYTSIDDKVANIQPNRLEARIYTDSSDFSYRLDGNNVDPEQEQVKLAANQLKYQGLMASLTAEFNNLKAVLK
ncbi:MAG: flagellar basal body rod protein FlgB [Lachnospiraceae bacterium]|nr:flagellar basal body rod protein FlgB [Lachnospiraceae bacterium]